MVKMKMCKSIVLIVFALVCVLEFAHGWEAGHATFYGNIDGDETAFGACGYDVFNQGYGLTTTALSTALFNNGRTCGACFQIVCAHSHKNCIQNAGSIYVTATNFCPPNSTIGSYPWCNPPRKHFDLSQVMFRKIARYEAGIVPVYFRRVSCRGRIGGMKFKMNGNPYWILVLVFNVGGSGEVVGVKVKGNQTGWIEMVKNWGQNWLTLERLLGQSLSFQVTTSDGKITLSNNVVPFNWQIGQTFEGNKVLV
ncbi:expansin-A25-like [Impatiens glandulifera]|uniref:expansin-A25-like n=1 Tax=Impatiens glandulifera TaxID=253017 RepID=UPI001FB0998A|nr:expansin-A25-like [Impatiens glandulifera]